MNSQESDNERKTTACFSNWIISTGKSSGFPFVRLVQSICHTDQKYTGDCTMSVLFLSEQLTEQIKS